MRSNNLLISGKKDLTSNKELTLYFNNLYPYLSFKKSKKRNLVVIGIGGNIGDTKRIFQKLFKILQADSRFFIYASSPLLKNPPFGFLKQKEFLNGIMVLQTNLSPKEVLKQMQRYELRFRRKRSFKDAPRTLDIDIIFFNKLKLKSKRLTIPHPHYSERPSVLIPLEFVLSV